MTYIGASNSALLQACTPCRRIWMRRCGSRPLMPFSRARLGDFVQAEPEPGNPFLGDAFVQRLLQRLLPPDVYGQHVQPDLSQFGQRVWQDIGKLGRQCEEQPPLLKKTTAWGRTVDHIVTCDAWKKQKAIVAEEQLVSIAYHRNPFSRIHQAAKLMLYSPASGMYSCPVAMTDGAAKTIQAIDFKHPELEEAFKRLTSSDPATFWTSGQWMTEKKGGSDVAGSTETVAVPQPEQNRFKLYGFKWFTSATDSEMSLTLARIVDPDVSRSSAASGLSLFFLRTRLAGDPCSSNGIEVMKLKDKLGTRQMPTAELLLDGCDALLISKPGKGISDISHMLTITRLHNVISSVAFQRHLLLCARDYAIRRHAFGTALAQHRLHLLTLARMETEVRGCAILLFDLARLLSLQETQRIQPDDALLLRLMMPVAKMFTAKKAMKNVSEALECFGGQGYIEDAGLCSILRDAQVLPIWEGTSNIMALDVLRAINRSHGRALLVFQHRISEVIGQAEALHPDTSSPVHKAAARLKRDLAGLSGFVEQQLHLQEEAGRDLAFSLANLYIACLLLEHAVACAGDLITLEQWLRRDLTPVLSLSRHGAYGLLSHLQPYVYDGYSVSE